MRWEYSIQVMESMKKWLKSPATRIIEQMNKYGQEEWELVAVSGDIAYYKRPVGGMEERRRLAEQQQKKVAEQKEAPQHNI
jgi:hypothetical protein